MNSLCEHMTTRSYRGIFHYILNTHPNIVSQSVDVVRYACNEIRLMIRDNPCPCVAKQKFRGLTAVAGTQPRGHFCFVFEHTRKGRRHVPLELMESDIEENNSNGKVQYLCAPQIVCNNRYFNNFLSVQNSAKTARRRTRQHSIHMDKRQCSKTFA